MILSLFLSTGFTIAWSTPMTAILATVIGKMKNNKTKQKESIKAGLLTYNCILQSVSFERFHCYYQTLSLTPARS